MKPLELATENDLIQVNTVEKPELMFTSHEKVIMKEVGSDLGAFERGNQLDTGKPIHDVCFSKISHSSCCWATEAPSSSLSLLSLITCDQKIEDRARQ